MTAHELIIGLVVVQRLLELALSRRNSRRLMARGGVEAGAGHYPLIVGLHAAWLAALVFAVPGDGAVQVPLLVLYLALQGVRYWIMAALGEYWTTRVISVPGAPLVASGPYRVARHPNYLVVAAELALLPMVFGAWEIAVLFTIANAGVMVPRIRAENAALAARRGGA
jgi:methyltransferase